MFFRPIPKLVEPMAFGCATLPRMGSLLATELIASESGGGRCRVHPLKPVVDADGRTARPHPDRPAGHGAHPTAFDPIASHHVVGLGFAVPAFGPISPVLFASRVRADSPVQRARHFIHQRICVRRGSKTEPGW